MAAPDTSRGDTTQKEVAEGIGDANSAASFEVSQGPCRISSYVDLALAAEPEPARAPGGSPLTAERAAQIVDDLQANARTGDRQAFEMVCRRAFEGAAHVALGFDTWPAFVESLGFEGPVSSPPAPLRAHPAADLFPMLDGTEFAALVDDIREHGQREPIAVMPDGSILDGRNRMRACQHLGIEPATWVYEGDDPIAVVVSLNLKRRHLNTSQRAMIAASLATLPRGANQHAQICAPSQKEAAELLNVSRRSVQDAAKIRAGAPPELADAVSRGDVSVSAVLKGLSVPTAPKRQNGSRQADRTSEAGGRISPSSAVTTMRAGVGPPTLAEAVRRVTAAIRDGASRADISEAVTAALKVHGGRNSLAGSAVLTELVGELLGAVRALAMGAS